MDYGISQVNPMAWYIVWKRPDGVLWILDEFYKRPCMPKEVAEWVNAQRTIWDSRRKLMGCYGCPRTFQKEKDGRTPAQYLNSDHGIVVSQHPVHFEVRYPIVFQALNDKRIKISEKCTNLIAELQSLTWETKDTGADHAIEALERGAVKALGHSNFVVDTAAINKNAPPTIMGNMLSRNF